MRGACVVADPSSHPSHLCLRLHCIKRLQKLDAQQRLQQLPIALLTP